jgi:hypothetical protein
MTFFPASTSATSASAVYSEPKERCRVKRETIVMIVFLVNALFYMAGSGQFFPIHFNKPTQINEVRQLTDF